MATQSSFAGPMERTEEVLERAARLHGDADHIVLATSGGTDSLVAADVDDQTTLFDSDSDAERAESMEIVGCSSTSCSDRNIPDWIRDLDEDRVVDRADVLDAWDGNAGDVVDRFRSLE